jgi:cysteine desulfurase
MTSSLPPRPVYLDCNATTPMEPSVRDAIHHYMVEEYGNAGSRTHDFGARAQQAVQRARDQVAAVVKAKRDEVVFTSGATESNNLALLGLTAFAGRSGRRHVVTTSVEHKAVLGPVNSLRQRGFEVTVLPVGPGGWVDPESVVEALRPDTLVVSVMQANNETGVLQPLNQIVEAVAGHDAFLHVDAAQGFGKDLEPLRSERIDLISASAHKLYGPKGVGALIARRRGFARPPLGALMFGGDQERGLRPGTLPVALLVGFGLAAELSIMENDSRRAANERYRDDALGHLGVLDPTFNGDQSRVLPHVLNVSFPGLDSEAVMVALRRLVAISNGSACTSQTYEPSHVLLAMGLVDAVVRGALRFSWSHLTPVPDWNAVVGAIRALR